MQKSLFSSLLLASVSASLTAHAANNDEINLPETLVTATRSDTAKNELASASTVYTREDIERLQVRTLPDLLKGSTGVDVVQQGGYGQLSSVFMRGTNSSHVLVLIDGIKAGSVTAGITAFELIPIEQIERVEIIRGPQSSLYGSEAIGGVIQIFTRKGAQTEKPSVSVEAGGGSYDTHREAGNISGRWQNTWYNLGVSNIESNGFKPKVTVDNGVANQGGYNNTAVNARVGHRFDNNAEVEAFFMRAEGMNQFAGYSDQDSSRKQFVNQVVGTSLTKDLLGGLRVQIILLVMMQLRLTGKILLVRW
jgi:vitamin B12 transporter